MRALVAEDEHLARKRLARLLRENGVEVVAEASSGTEAVRLLRQESVDVAFLDVEMPGTDGLGVVQEVGIDFVPRVVFVTAHDQYALEAFRLHAVDYLLKPFDQERLQGTLTHLRRMDTSPASDDARPWRDRLEALVQDVVGRSRERDGPYAERLLLKEDTALQFVRVDDIECIEADGNYVRVRIGDAHHLLRRQIGDLEAQLDPSRFVRIHRSAIVNLDAVECLVQWFSGGYLVRLRSGRELKLSRGYAAKLFERVGTTL